jgi:hypothetical protein
MVKFQIEWSIEAKLDLLEAKETAHTNVHTSCAPPFQLKYPTDISILGTFITVSTTRRVMLPYGILRTRDFHPLEIVKTSLDFNQ